MMEVTEKVNKLSGIMPPPFKGVFAYLIVLVIVSLILLSVRAISTDSIVIHVKKDSPGSLQVFFPVISSAYSEENSKQFKLVAGTLNVLRVTLPRTEIRHVRIDPANSATNILITKVELKHLFGTETYNPSELFELVKPIQMVDELKVTSAGLIIKSTGDDPALEMQIKRPSLFSQLIKLSALSFFLSFIVFFVVTKMKFDRSQKEKIYVFVIPLFASLVLTALFYPGAMSYDSLHALYGARGEVMDSQWPPMISYVWRVIDFVSLNPSAMHFSQVFLLLFSAFFIVYVLTKRIAYASVFLVIYMLIPVMLGTMAVIWKDVLMASFFMSGFAVTLYLRSVTGSLLFKSLVLIAVLLIFLGVCSRHNAITGAVPLLVYLSWVVCSRYFKQSKYVWSGVILMTTVLTGSTFFTKTLLDAYSLPDFNKLPSSTSVFIESVRVLDVAGASICVGENLFADVAPDLSMDVLRNIYNPRHANLSKELVDRSDVYIGITERWINVALHHPICFFYNKMELTKYLVAANQGPQFLITHTIVNDNTYGYTMQDSSIRNAAYLYIKGASQIFIVKPWFIYLLSIFAFAYMVKNRALTPELFTMYVSALFYFGGLVAFGNAADARLLFYTTTALTVFTFVSAVKYKMRANE